MRPSPGAPAHSSGDAPLPKLVLAFAAVYVIWGSTYLAIRFAIETIEPFTMAAIRFAIAGSILYGIARARGISHPEGRHWKSAAIAGTLLLAGGNGAVVVAEQWIPSGFAALIVATVPLWLVAIDALFGDRVRPSRRSSFGLIVGLVGVGVLTGAEGAGAGGREEFFGVFLLLCGSAAWAVGSIYTRQAADPPPPVMRVALQMLGGSVSLALLALALEDPISFDPSAVSARSWLALVYLIVFGAIIGYTAYIWLLGVTTPARAGTYAYVNPVVALILGWWLADEPLGFRSLVAGAIILGSVIVITTDRSESSPRRAAEEPKGQE